MALIKDYFEKTKHYSQEYGEKTIVLMQVGAFFEVYGLEDKAQGVISASQLVDFTRICDLNIADKKICVGTSGVLMAGFSHYMIDKYLKKLQEAGYSVVVYVQDEQAKNTSRSLHGIYSPGTYFSPESSKITNNTVCIWVNVSQIPDFSKRKQSVTLERKLVTVGAANINIYTGKSTMLEFQESYYQNPTTFDELERFISIYSPSEAILLGNVSEKELNSVVSYANIQCSSIHIISLLNKESETQKGKRAFNCEKQKYQKEIIDMFYGKRENIGSNPSFFFDNFYENAVATQAFCFLLDFIYQHNPNLVYKIAEPTFENCSDRLILANHSLKQLNIIDDENSGLNNRMSSVEKLLNICITPMGRREFSNILLHPSTNAVNLKKEYDVTEHFLSYYSEYEILLKNKLSGIKDISKLTRQMMMKKITPKSLNQLYVTLELSKGIHSGIHSGIETTEFYKYLQDSISEMPNILVFCEKIMTFLDTNFYMNLCADIESHASFEQNFIKHGVDEELDKCEQTLLESSDKLETIRCHLSESISNYEGSKKKTVKKKEDGEENAGGYVKIHETEKNHLSLVATKRRCSNLKELLKKSSPSSLLKYISSFNGEEMEFEFTHELEFYSQTAANDSISSPTIQELCKNISIIKIQMKDVITRVYLKILKEMEEFQKPLEFIIQFIMKTDIVFAKATIAKQFRYCKPEIVADAEKSFINAENLRHCLIEHIQQNEIYVTNDICLGDNSDGILLYGTNAVGKTSFIRALGIAVIMAQAGLYVPCSSFRFKPYKTIFTRILGNDNIFKGLSTFAVEMYELRTILRLADNSSLILGDELCSGTESISAISIFVAGIKQLAERKCSFIFATHLHEIVGYSEIEELKRVVLKHMAVVYDKEKDTLVYDRKLREGSGENMYGLEVCKSLHLPTDFLELAYEIRTKYFQENPLSLKVSHYNSKKIMGLCEKCKKEMGTEVHHIHQQKNADKDGMIQGADGSIFHKNHLANLMTVCESCHHEFHRA